MDCQQAYKDGSRNKYFLSSELTRCKVFAYLYIFKCLCVCVSVSPERRSLLGDY